MEKKSKKEILKMSRDELIDEKWKGSGCTSCLDCSDCSYCSCCLDCSGCSGCLRCLDCSDCSYCRFQKNKRYMIANVQFTKSEYEKWKKYK